VSSDDFQSREKRLQQSRQKLAKFQATIKALVPGKSVPPKAPAKSVKKGKR
jgi:hypothetical protein